MNTSDNIRPGLPPHFQDSVMETMTGAGMSPAAAAAMAGLDADFFLWHRRVAKGEVPGRIIAELGIDLELSQFNALTAITRIQWGVGRPGGEPATIGLLADELNLDPSRASRIASDLIERGYLQRAAAQEDGRKSVVVLTPKAIGVMIAFRDRKWAKMIEMFRDWPEQDIIEFSRLFARYGEAVERVYAKPE